MKKALVILSTFVLAAWNTVCGQTQEFAPVGAEWYFEVSSFFMVPASVFRMASIGDTVINGHQCRIITEPFLCFSEAQSGKQYVYNEGSVVYWYNVTNDDFTILYDFSLEAGEGWTIEIDSCSYYLEIESVEEVTWEGHTYRVQRLRYDWPIFYGDIIEGIGYVGGLFPDCASCSETAYDGPYPYNIRCYLEDGEQLYHTGPYGCDEFTYWNGSIADAYAGGDGSEENPYQIATAAQLALLAKETNDGTGGNAHYIQTNNISLNRSSWDPTYEWPGIGNIYDYYWMYVHYFTGVYDGNGYWIDNMCQGVNDSIISVGGLFGMTQNAVIKNVTLKNSRIKSNNISGGIIGSAGNTQIINCHTSNVSIESGTVGGGIVGEAGVSYLDYIYNVHGEGNCYIVDCSASGIITSLNHLMGHYTGGIAGNIGVFSGVALVKDCVNRCQIEAYEDYSDGGIVGHCYSTENLSEIVGCENYGSINAQSLTEANYNGGIAGMASGKFQIKDCTNYGVVGNEEIGYTGGIVGGCSAEVCFCNNYGDCIGVFAGGIVGQSDISSIHHCLNEGKVMAPAGAAGIVAQNEYGDFVYDCTNLGQIESICDRGGAVACGITDKGYAVNCVNRGNIVATGDAVIVGGIVNLGSAYNCYNMGDVAGYPSETGYYILVGGIVGASVPGAEIRNVYNAGNVIGEGNSHLDFYGFGNILGYSDIDDGVLVNCYWRDENRPAHGRPEFQNIFNSSHFSQGETDTQWLLDTAQFGTNDLVEALNFGRESLENDSLFDYTLNSWMRDEAMENNGLPVFGSVNPIFNFDLSEWFYEIQNGDGSITYQHLQCSNDTVIENKRPKIIIRSNTLYDEKQSTTVTHEYVYEENGIVYWWNKTLNEFTVLYNLNAEAGDEWQIRVGTETITVHVDAVDDYDYEGRTYKMLQVSDEDDVFGGTIVCGIGHLTSFFPERLMSKNYRVEGMRCYWKDGELVFKYGDKDCDEVYIELHSGVEDLDNQSFRIYPNPAKGCINVETTEENANYEIVNIMGQTVLSGSLNGAKQISLDGLSDGMYFIKVGQKTEKFVVGK